MIRSVYTACWPTCLSSSPSSYSISLSRIESLCSFGTTGTSSKISCNWSRMCTVPSGSDLEGVTTNTVLDSTTERTAYVFSDVHNTASSVGCPLMKRLGVTVSNQIVDGREENPPGSFLRSRFNYLAQLWRKLQKPKRTCVLSSSRRQSEIQFAHGGFGLEGVLESTLTRLSHSHVLQQSRKINNNQIHSV